MTIEERAQVIYDELTTYKKADPVAWLAAALRQFEQEIERQMLLESGAITDAHDTRPLAMAAAVPDGED